MQYVLHIDTSTDVCAISLGADGRLVASRANAANRNHAATLNLMTEDMLAETGIGLNDLAAVAVCAGPGSYTGLRIGMATAKGYCYALDKPLMAHNRLTLLAWQAYSKYGQHVDQYVSLLKAREQEYFIAVYGDEFQCVTEPQHILEEQLLPLVQQNQKTVILTDTGEITEKLSVHTGEITGTELDHMIWCSYSFSQLKSNNIVNLANAEPFYLKQVYTHK